MFIRGIKIPGRLVRSELSQYFWDVLEEIAIAQYVKTIQYWQDELDNIDNSPYSEQQILECLDHCKNASIADFAEVFVGLAHSDFAGVDFADLITDGEVQA